MGFKICNIRNVDFHSVELDSFTHKEIRRWIHHTTEFKAFYVFLSECVAHRSLTSQGFWICSSHWRTLAGLCARWHEHWGEQLWQMKTHSWKTEKQLLSLSLSFCFSFQLKLTTAVFSHLNHSRLWNQITARLLLFFFFVLTCCSRTRQRSSV